MKKNLLITVFVAASFSLFSQNVDTIVAWTFPTGIDTVDNHPDIFIAGNESRYIAAEDTAYDPNERVMTFTEGVTTFAATATEWQDGSGSKLWSIKFKAPGYKNFKVSSKQYSDIAFPGPKDWKLEAKLSGGEWVDLEGGDVVCSNDWTTGVVADLELPDEFDDPGTTSIYVRWIMTSNLNTAGNNVESNGISKIDDVVITGELISGIGENNFIRTFHFYPNPAAGNKLYIESTEPISRLNIYSTKGQLLNEIIVNQSGYIDLPELMPGLYLAEPVLKDGKTGTTERLIIR